MCKSQAEGGQRCSGHALTAVNNTTAKYLSVVKAFDRGEATGDQLQAANEANSAAMVAYASTIDGATDITGRYHALDPYDEDSQAYMLAILDDGAVLAQTNRAVENAYRATQGKPPLTTPVPQTRDQLAAQATERNRQAAEAAAKAADPLGLRAATPAIRYPDCRDPDCYDDDCYGECVNDDLNYPIRRTTSPTPASAPRTLNELVDRNRPEIEASADGTYTTREGDTTTRGHKTKGAAIKHLAEGAAARANAVGQPLPWRLAIAYKRHIKSLPILPPHHHADR